MRRLLRPLALALALVAASPSGSTADEPLDDQEIVRMVVAGRSSAQIVAAIRSREVRFDLSPEMLEELRIAGVPQSVRDAMLERQAEMEPAPSASSGKLEEEKGTLTVLLQAEAVRAGERSALWFPDRVEEDLAHALRLGPAPRERRVTDLAVFLACLTPEHVPDQWRSRSPLGTDFLSMPRHELLVLHAGAVVAPASDVPRSVKGSFPPPRKDDPPPAILRLDLPHELLASLEPGQKHRVLFGVALRVADTYLLLASAEQADVVPEAGSTLHARIVQGKTHGAPLRVELTSADPAAR